MDVTTAPIGATDAQMDAASRRLAEIAGHQNVLDAEVVAITAELIGNEGWRQGGKLSPSAYLQWQLGLAPGRADAIVSVARRSDEFPALMGAFGRGELSLDQVAAAMKAPAWADELILDFVKISTVPKIRRAMRSNMFTPDPDAPADVPAPPVDRLSFRVTDGGRWRISGELDLADGRRIEAALAERRDALFIAGNTDVTMPEAFVDCMERSLDAVESSSRRDRFRTWLHLDVTDGTATSTDGWVIPPSVSDRICCDGVVQAVWERDGVPFSVGRAQYIVPLRTRRVVELRDRGCRVPGCGRERHVEIHHIVPWLNGGRTDTPNLVSLCPAHHKLHHQGRLGISGDADQLDGLVFTDERGATIPGSGSPAPPSGPPPPTEPYVRPLADRFDWRWIGNGWIHPTAQRQLVERARQLAQQRPAA